MPRVSLAVMSSRLPVLLGLSQAVTRPCRQRGAKAHLAEHVDAQDLGLVPQQGVHGHAVIDAPQLGGAVEGGAAQLVRALPERQPGHDVPVPREALQGACA